MCFGDERSGLPIPTTAPWQFMPLDVLYLNAGPDSKRGEPRLNQKRAAVFYFAKY